MKSFASPARVRFQVCRFLAVPLLALWTSDLWALTASEQNARSFLTAQLVEHSKQLGETDIKQRSLLRASPARIALVMREVLLLNDSLSQRLELRDLVTASLAAEGLDTNPLKDEVAKEVVKALVALPGVSGNGARIAEVVLAALSVNSGGGGSFENSNTISIKAKQAVVGFALNAAGSREAGELIARDAYDFAIRSASGGLNGANGSEAASFIVSSLSGVTQDPKGAVSGFVEEFIRRVQVPGGNPQTDYGERFSYLTQRILTNSLLSGKPMVLGEVVGSSFKNLPSVLSPTEKQSQIAQSLAGLINNTIRARGSRIVSSLPYAVGAAVAQLDPMTQNRSGFAEDLIGRLLTSNQTAEVRGQIFSGFLRGVGKGADSDVNLVLAAFLDREFNETPTKKVGKVVTAKDLNTFIDNALTGNGVGSEELQDEAGKVRITVNVVADRLSQTFINSRTKQVDIAAAFKAADDLGARLIGKLVGTNPGAAGAVVQGIVEGYKVRGFFPDQSIVTDVTNFVTDLVKNRNTFVSNHAAMSSLTGAAIGFFPSTASSRPVLDSEGNPVLDENGQPQQEPVLNPEEDKSRLVNLSSSLIRAAPKAIVPVASRAAENLDVVYARTFGMELAQRMVAVSTSSVATQAGQISQIAIGVAQEHPSLAPTLAQDLILMSKTTVVRGRSVTTNPFASSADLIAGTVAKAIPVEGVADIATRLAATAVTNPLIPLTEIAQLASTLARAINEKPTTVVLGVNRLEPVRTYNRVDELGELAAALVGNVLGKSATEKAELELVRSITLNVLSSLATRNASEGLYESADVLPRMAADGSYMSSAVATILGDVAQTISVSSNIAEPRKRFLLRSQAEVTASGSRDSTLEKLLVDAMVAKSGLRGIPLTNYRNALLAVFAEVRSAGYGNLVSGEETVGRLGEKGKYEIGSVNDPETPVNNG
jgi:hypothetical protein